jgi:drug/metabolite transporter (DMT)-like permease
VLHPAVLLLIGAAVCNALYYLLTRKLPREVMHTTLFYSSIVGTVALTFVMPFVLRTRTSAFATADCCC